MPKYIAALTMVLLLGTVIIRVFLLKKQGITAMQFGNIDKTDFLIPPLPSAATPFMQDLVLSY